MRSSFVRSALALVACLALVGPAEAVCVPQILECGGTEADLSSVTPLYLVRMNAAGTKLEGVSAGDLSTPDTTCNDAGVVCLFAGSATEGGPATSALTATNADNLTTDPSDCSAGLFATSVDRQADLGCVQVAFANLSGSATDAQIPNGITVDQAANCAAATVAAASLTLNYPLMVESATGSLPMRADTDITWNSVLNQLEIVSGGKFVGDLDGDVNGHASSASVSTTAATIDCVTNADNLAFDIPFASVVAGNATLRKDGVSGPTYNPSTNTLVAGTFSGAATQVVTADAAGDVLLAIPLIDTGGGNKPILYDGQLTYNATSNAVGGGAFWDGTANLANAFVDDPLGCAAGEYVEDIDSQGDAVCEPLPTGAPVYVTKVDADQNRNTNTALIDVTGMTIALAANKTYVFEGFIRGSQASGTPNLKLALDVPASSSLWVNAHAAQDGVAVRVEDMIVDSTGYVLETGAGDYTVRLSGIIKTAGTAGNVDLMFAQGTSHASNTAIAAGTWMRVTVQ